MHPYSGLYLSNFIRGGVEVLAIEVDDRANAQVHRNMEADKIESEGNYAVSLYQLIKVQNYCSTELWNIKNARTQNNIQQHAMATNI